MQVRWADFTKRVNQTASRGLARLRRDRRGSVAIIVGLCMTMMIAAAAMALDLTGLYVAQTNAQRIADQSAVAAAFAYSNSSDNATTAQNAASSLASANGALGATTTAAVVTSPSGDGNKAVQVTVSLPVTLSPFGQMNNGGITTGTVNATAYAEIQSGVAGCIITQTGGVSASGGEKIAATSCAVASAASTTASSGANFSASAFYAVGSVTASNGGSISTTPTSGQLFPGSSTPSDPYANSGIFSRISTVSALTAPSFPSIGSAPSGGTAQNCTGTLTLPAGTTYGTITASAGCTAITFTGGVGTTTNVSGSGLAPNMSSGGNLTITFGPGTYNLNGFNLTGAGATFTVNINGAPTINVFANGVTNGNTAVMNVNGSATWNIVGGLANKSTGKMTVSNTDSSTPSTFYVASGIKATSGTLILPNGTYVVTSGGVGNNATTLTFGNGSFNIAGGITFSQGGGSMTFGSALDGNSIFQVATPISSSTNAISTSGGSTLTIGSFTNVDVNGGVALSGSASFGAGVYTVAGAFNAAASGGGSITGTGVQIVASGAISFAQGYSTIDIEAPTAITTSTLGAFGTVALATNSASASSFAAGATDSIVVGAIYLPSAALGLSGSANLTGNGGCLVVDVGSLSLSGSGQLKTDCTGISGSGTSSVALVR